MSNSDIKDHNTPCKGFDLLFGEHVAKSDRLPEDFDDLFDAYLDCGDEESGASAVSSITGRAKAMQNAILKDVIGQDHAVSAVVSGYFRSELSALTDTDRKRPATFLFAGSPGVGKTFLADRIASHLKRPFKRFDMSEYGDQDGAIEFIGSDNVFSGAKGGNFTSFVSANPKSVILFDEIEKAHVSVIHLFLQILDEGTVRDSNTDRSVCLKDTVLIFTTNAGRQLYEGAQTDLSGVSRRVILKALERDVDPQTGKPYFPAAICSRFASGNVVLFNKMNASSLCRLAKKEIERDIKGLKDKVGIDVTVDGRVYPAILFAEGGMADARGVKGRAEAFFNDELYEFFRLTSGERGGGAVDHVEKIRFEVELPESTDVQALFNGFGEDVFAVAAEGGCADTCRELSAEGCELVVTDSISAVDELIRKRDVKAALIDLNYQRVQDFGEYLNTEDIDSMGRKIFIHVREKYPDLPVYMLESEGFTLDNEERLSLLRLGVSGFLPLTGDKNALCEELRGICASIHYSEGINHLASTNKLVSFETAQKLSADKKTGIIKLFDFRTATAVDPEDSESLLSTVLRPDVRLSDVIGADEAKKELKYFIDYLKNPKKFAAKGVRTPKGVLLYGPSGTGKTMLARAMAGESDVTFITAEGNQFLKKYVGEGPRKVHELFRRARKYAPSILFIDEIDAIGRIRTGEGDGVDQTLTALLTEMDGFNTDPTKPVFILAATNFGIDGEDSRTLDPALVRRFDRRILLELPTRPERRELLEKRIGENRTFAVSESGIERIAMRSTGMSLSQLSDVLELSLRSALREGGTVTDEIFEEAFETYQGGSSRGWDEESLRRVALHEAGHAYISCKNGNIPSYVTVVARGKHGGYVQGGFGEEKRIYTRTELLSAIRASLGGRAAELVFYGESEGLSTSAVSDLAAATEQAFRLVCLYGMDADFGMSVVAEPTSSPEAKAVVDRILKKELDAAVKAVKDSPQSVLKIRDALLAKNRLDGEELCRLLGITEK